MPTLELAEKMNNESFEESKVRIVSVILDKINRLSQDIETFKNEIKEVETISYKESKKLGKYEYKNEGVTLYTNSSWNK